MSCMRQVLELQTQALPLDGSGQAAPPAQPPPGWKARVMARQKVSGMSTQQSPVAFQARRLCRMTAVRPLQLLLSMNVRCRPDYLIEWAFVACWRAGMELQSTRSAHRAKLHLGDSLTEELYKEQLRGRDSVHVQHLRLHTLTETICSRSQGSDEMRQLVISEPL